MIGSTAVDQPSNELRERGLNHYKRIFVAFIFSAVCVFLLAVTEFTVLHYFRIGKLRSAYGSSIRIERSLAFNDTRSAVLWTKFYCDLGGPFKKTVFAVDFREKTVLQTEPEFLHPSARVISGRLDVAGEHPTLRSTVLCNGVAVVAQGSLIEAWAPGATEPKWTYMSDEGNISAIDSVENNVFYAASGRMIQLDGDTGRVSGKSMKVGGYIHNLAASPCRQYIAIVKDSSATFIAQASTRDASSTGFKGPASLSTKASTEQSGICDQLLVIRLSDQKQCLSRQYVSKLFRPVFSPDGQRLVIAEHSPGESVCIVRIEDGGSEVVVGKHPGATGGYWDPNSSVLYSWGHDGFIRAWNLESGKLKWQFQMQSDLQTPFKIALANAQAGVFQS